MLKIKMDLSPAALDTKIHNLFTLSENKIKAIDRTWNSQKGTPVFTVQGKYTSRGWTEWTQGFQFGSEIIQFDATGDTTYLYRGREHTVQFMAPHVSHIGVHDHGFNNVSTFGNLLRLMHEGRIADNEWEKNFYELALKLSGAVQAARWTDLPDDLGFVRSFNGPHSLFADTIRSMRALALSHTLGHVLMGEKDTKINLLKRILQHAETTAQFNVYFGQGRDAYDVRGRVAHESIFNLTDGSYRCPSSQQGFSPLSTWTRGLAWILTGFAEQLEYLSHLQSKKFDGIMVGELSGKQTFIDRFLEVTLAVADFYIEYSPTDGIPYWDTGAPGLANMNDYLDKPADPYNNYEPVDSSAAAIAAQGLLRLGQYLQSIGKSDISATYFQAGLTVADTLFDDPYLSKESTHQGLLLHSVYHRPNGWDYIPKGKKIPFGESSMWGDYHARELALYIKRMAENGPYYTFFGTL